MTANLESIIERVVEARRREAREDQEQSRAGSRIPETIERIRSTYHRDWEERRLGEAQALRASLAEGIPVPVLSACGHGTAETRFTQYLAYFLNPSKPHGLRARYLAGLLSLMRRSNPSIPSDIDMTGQSSRRRPTSAALPDETGVRSDALATSWSSAPATCSS